MPDRIGSQPSIDAIEEALDRVRQFQLVGKFPRPGACLFDAHSAYRFYRPLFLLGVSPQRPKTETIEIRLASLSALWHCVLGPIADDHSAGWHHN